MKAKDNGSWADDWVVDLENATATNRDGWVFKFGANGVGGYNGECVQYPRKFDKSQIEEVARIAIAAADAYKAALKTIH